MANGDDGNSEPSGMSSLWAANVDTVQTAKQSFSSWTFSLVIGQVLLMKLVPLFSSLIHKLLEACLNGNVMSPFFIINIYTFFPRTQRQHSYQQLMATSSLETPAEEFKGKHQNSWHLPKS